MTMLPMKHIQSPKNQSSPVANTEEHVERQMESVDPNQQADKKVESNSFEVTNNQHKTEKVDGKTLLESEQKEEQTQVQHQPTTCGVPDKELKATDIKTETSIGACNDCLVEKGSVKARISTFEEHINKDIPKTKKEVPLVVPWLHLEPTIAVITDGKITEIIYGRRSKMQKKVIQPQCKRTVEDNKLENEIEIIEEGICIDQINKKGKKRSRFRKWMRRFGQACSNLSERMFYCCNNITVV
ncbi:hypothetical protein LOTGIDRAFT_161225 [Lottia gigantea]|uniref:Uncharacterized protein n=1 Tax=Lottia gigantea TaxID=225164 RepID=V4BZF0_LOTGI|nr:hypothetical protein LOTGIDRAFT_161225 [Lottia gigantea]ESO94524.1 hypothetical protein LOTGIDRAFT_161225 [Lottia gigantea]